MLYIKLFIEREKNTGQSAPECPFNMLSAAEERCEPSGKCHGIVREFHIVWRVVTLNITSILWCQSQGVLQQEGHLA